MPGNCAAGAYGCDHHAEHVTAAYRAWRTKRGQSEQARYTRAERSLSAAYGVPVEKVHRHKEHKSQVRYKADGVWYQMSRGEFTALEKWAQQTERENAREKAAIAKSSEAERVKQLRRELADLKSKHQMQLWAEQETRKNYARVRSHFRSRGIAPSKSTQYYRHLGREVPKDYSEWQMLPSDIRRKSGRYDLDSARHVLAEEGAISESQAADWTTDDTVKYFEKMREFNRDADAARHRRLQDIKAAQEEIRQARASSTRRAA